MTTDNDSVRKDFEAKFPVPTDAIYNAKLDQYSWNSHPNSAHPFNDRYEAWQASRERYEPKPVAEVHKNSAGQVIMRNMDGSTFDISKHVGYVLVPATPNGGNES